MLTDPDAEEKAAVRAQKKTADVARKTAKVAEQAKNTAAKANLQAMEDAMRVTETQKRLSVNRPSIPTSTFLAVPKASASGEPDDSRKCRMICSFHLEY